MMFNKITFTFLMAIVCLLLNPDAIADNWTAKQSDPQELGLMEGFPPPLEKRIMLPDSNFFSFPKLRWTVCHFRELLPTEQINRGLNPSLPFEYQLDTETINSLSFTPIGSNQTMTWEDSLEANFTDGMLILNKGKIVYEYYDGCLNQTGKHGAMSMTKSLTGLLAEILIAENKLDDTVLVSSIIPELSESAFGNATVRQVMDMTTSLDYSEDYSDPNADIWILFCCSKPMA